MKEYYYIISLGILGLLFFQLNYLSIPDKPLLGEALSALDMSRVERTLPDSVGVNEEFTVELHVTIDSGFEHYIYLVEEIVPNNMEIISSDGIVNGNRIKFAAIAETSGQPIQAESTILSYTVRSNSVGQYDFDGQYFIDGMDNPESIDNAHIEVGCNNGATRSCTAICDGTQECRNHEWGECISSQYLCDTDCDGTNECSDNPCRPCECEESWECTDWSDCIDRTKSRACLDINNCGTTDFQPTLSERCRPCRTWWRCTAWTECNDHIQTRTCTDRRNCNTLGDTPREIRNC